MTPSADNPPGPDIDETCKSYDETPAFYSYMYEFVPKHRHSNPFKLKKCWVQPFTKLDCPEKDSADHTGYHCTL